MDAYKITSECTAAKEKAQVCPEKKQTGFNSFAKVIYYQKIKAEIRREWHVRQQNNFTGNDNKARSDSA